MSHNKKQYEAPKIVIHGDIRSITQGSTGPQSDGGFFPGANGTTQTGSL